ncbi:MAG: hypothetical protein PHF56_00770 [Desulfuromonadaceae bacterium]|nr:hypothetical protein [Desulfuromonadaceae bacterium]
MKSAAVIFFSVMLFTAMAYCADAPWYAGDQRCPPPKDDGTYSAPYNALEHQQEYPTFPDADKPGWSCSYHREDGVLVQYGDSRTPQQQWLAVWDRHNLE